jgi:hypothetical protein
MTPTEQGILRIGYAPFAALAGMVALIALAMCLPFSGWATGAAFGAILVGAVQLVRVFIREGERRGAPRDRIQLVGVAAFVITVTVAYVVRSLWTGRW